MSLINAKTRFAWDAVNSVVYDYKTNKSHPPTGTLHDRDGGVWDLAHLAHLLRNGQFIDTAHFRDKNPAQPAEAEKPYVGKAKDLTIQHVPQQASEDPKADTTDTTDTTGIIDTNEQSSTGTDQQQAADTTQGDSDVATDNGAAQGTS